MSDLILSNSPDSPFDSIRHVDDNGCEYWFARELMPLLGYQKWQKFKVVIETAVENVETVVSSTLGHFLPLEVKNIEVDGTRGRGRSGLDYKLSRLACYHVALSCDSRGNDSVKSAKHYFAVKTREAETVIPAQSDRIRELELQLALAEAETRKALAEKSVLDTRHLIVSTCPEPVQQKILGYQEVKIVEYRDRHFDGSQMINDGSTINKTELCKRYGLLTRAEKPDYKKLNALLELTGMLDRSDVWELTAVIQENQQFRREFLPTLDRLILDGPRQLFLGE